MQIWELQPKQNEQGKDVYQDCTLTILQVLNQPNIGASGYGFQNAVVLGQNGMQMPASILYKSGEPPIGQDKLSKPIQARVKVVYGNDQYSFNGMKYTIMLSAKPSSSGGGYSGKSFGGRTETPEERNTKMLLMLYAYAKDLAVAKIIKLEDIKSFVVNSAVHIVSVVQDMSLATKAQQQQQQQQSYQPTGNVGYSQPSNQSQQPNTERPADIPF